MLSPDSKFLIVDDYSNIRKLLLGQLSRFGIKHIVEKESADLAMEYLQGLDKVDIDFIISDWNMPGSNGLQFLQWVRSQAFGKNLPFLILTTENEQAKIMEAISNGVSNFLLKPWEEEDLSEKIALCWKKHHG